MKIISGYVDNYLDVVIIRSEKKYVVRNIYLICSVLMYLLFVIALNMVTVNIILFFIFRTKTYL